MVAAVVLAAPPKEKPKNKNFYYNQIYATEQYETELMCLFFILISNVCYIPVDAADAALGCEVLPNENPKDTKNIC